MVLLFTVKFAPMVKGCVLANVTAELMVRVLPELGLPRTVLPKALKVLLLLTIKPPLAVMGAEGENVVTALTVKLWLPLLPNTTLAFAVKGAFAVMGAVGAKVVAELTVRVLVPLAVPRTASPRALNRLPLLTVTAALAVTAAPGAKVVAALTARVLLLLLPSTLLPRAVNR